MDWKDEEIEDVETAGGEGGTKSAMTRAVELAAARGGTMDATTLEQNLSRLECGTTTTAMVREHISALGARNAVLEAERDNAREVASRLEAAVNEQHEEKVRLRERCEDLESRRLAAEESNRELVRRAQQAEALLERERKWSAGLERLAAERHDTIRRTCEVVKELEARCATLSAAGQGAHMDNDSELCPLRNGSGWTYSVDRWPKPMKSERVRCWCQEEKPQHYPCSPTCTHDDAAKPGHHERVRERSEAWAAMHPRGSCTCAGEGVCAWCDSVARVEVKEEIGLNTPTQWGMGYDAGAEAMRAACWEAVRAALADEGWTDKDATWRRFKSAIEGAVP